MSSRRPEKRNRLAKRSAVKFPVSWIVGEVGGAGSGLVGGVRQQGGGVRNTRVNGGTRA